MQHYTTDSHFKPILDQMAKTRKAGNVGQIPRITGDTSTFRTHTKNMSLRGISDILFTTDGGLLGFDLSVKAHKRKFVQTLKTKGVMGLIEEGERIAREDPLYEHHPRFRDIDDRFLIHLKLF